MNGVEALQELSVCVCVCVCIMYISATRCMYITYTFSMATKG